MKISIFIFVILFNFIGSIAQNNIIPNPGFESMFNNYTNCISNTFPDFNDNIQNWRVYKSNPSWAKEETKWINASICSPASGFQPDCNSFQTNGSDRFVRIRSNINGNCNKRIKDNVAVALVGGNSFKPNVWYTIRIKFVPISGVHSGNNWFGCSWTLTYCQLRVFASKKGPLNWKDNSGNVREELINANIQTGHIINCDWRVAERRFKVNSSGLTTLAFLSETGGFLIDDIEVFEECDNNYIIQNKTYKYPTYAIWAIEGQNLKEMAGQNLIAGTNVGSTNPIGPVKIDALSHVIYTAQNSIKLKPGFNAVAGSQFHAVNAPCYNNIIYKLHSDSTLNPINTELDDFENKFSEAILQPNDNSGFVISPNPFDYNIKLSAGSSLIRSVILRNNIGAIVLELHDFNSSSIDLEIPAIISSGVYQITVLLEDGASLNKMIIKN